MDDIQKEEDIQNLYANFENRAADNVYETLNLNHSKEGADHDSKHRASWKSCAACLGLLSSALIAAIAALCVQYLHVQKNIHELQQTFSEHQVNFTTYMHDQMAQYNNISTARDELQKSYNSLVKEIGQLRADNEAKTTHIQQLQLEKQALTTKVSEKERQVIELGGICADGWQGFKCGCYFASTDAKNWTASRKDCQTRGGDLVVIKNREEQEFLGQMNKSFTVFWIGLSDVETEGVWTWVDSTPLHQGYWQWGEPNNAGQDEDCAVSQYYKARSRWGYLHEGLQLWNDIPCSAKSHWICERNPH